MKLAYALLIAPTLLAADPRSDVDIAVADHILP